MLLQGNLQEFSLPNIFQLVKMSAKSGALTIRREGGSGKVFFRDGTISYAYSQPQLLPLGERLVKAGAISSAQLKQALAAQKKSGGASRLGGILLKQGHIDRETLEQAVREQIQDTAFTFFSWSDGEFEFAAEDTPPEEDVLVEMSVETVIMEGCRRIDEWALIFEQLGSLERVPHLAYGEHVAEEGSLTLTAEEWRVVVHIDGRADINTILRDCGLDRFHGAKVMYSLYSSGLINVSEPVIESIGKGTSVAVRGAIDIYNEVFLNTLTDSNVVKQLRVELIDEKEVEIPIVAGQLPSGNGNGNGEGRRERRPTYWSSRPRPRAPSRPGSGSPARARRGSSWPTPTTWTACAPRAPTCSSSRASATCPTWSPRTCPWPARSSARSRSPRRSGSTPPRPCCTASCATARRWRMWCARPSSSPRRAPPADAALHARPARAVAARSPRQRPHALVFVRCGGDDGWRRRAAPGPARRKDTTACTTPATA